MINTILESFDIWTRSQTIKSNGRTAGVDNQRLLGIDKLRELILELAVRGKLVPQDEKDEPTILAKNKILLKDEAPFELPENWLWTTLGNIGKGSTGKTPSTNVLRYFNGEIPFIGPGQITSKGEIILESDKTLTLEGSEFSTVANDGDILMVCIGGTIGKTAMVKSTITFNQQINCIHPLIGNSWFWNYVMNAPYFQKLVLQKSTGSATPIINRSKWEEIPVPLPPLAEQHRIVAKVDELMALCDQLEQQQTSTNTTHHQLVELLLQNLTEASGQEAFATAWKRIATNFDTLFTTEYSIDQLKQTILQLAVMGKLVPQDPRDEPASELLRKIAKEKERLVKEGKIKMQEKLPEITKEEKPFELPRGWEWARPDEFSKKITDGEHFRPSTQEHGIYFLSAKDIRAEGVSIEDPLFVSEETASIALQRCNPQKGDILIVSRGATVGRMCTVDIDEVFCLLGSVILLKPMTQIFSEYLKVVMKSPIAIKKLISASGSTAQPAIYLRDLKKILFPIAPLAEQHRIVAKVDELFALCDALKERIKEAQETQGMLAEGVV